MKKITYGIIIIGIIITSSLTIIFGYGIFYARDQAFYYENLDAEYRANKRIELKNDWLTCYNQTGIDQIDCYYEIHATGNEIVDLYLYVERHIDNQYMSERILYPFVMLFSTLLFIVFGLTTILLILVCVIGEPQNEEVKI